MKPGELLDLLRLAMKALGEKRTRSALTIIGIAIGPTALIAILGVVQGYSNYVINQIQGLGQNVIIVIPHAGYTLSQSDVEMIKALPHVEYVTPFYATRIKVLQGGHYIDAEAYAVNLRIFFKALKKLHLEAGTIPSPNDIVGAVVGKYIAYGENGVKYYGVGDVLTFKYYKIESGTIKIKTANVVIKGILAEFGNAFFVNPDDTVFLPLAAGRRLFGFSKWSGLIIIVSSARYVEPITKKLRSIYGDRATVISLIEISRVVSSITTAMKFVTTAAGSAAFVVAITGVAAAMITSVMERTREIGVMKAIGFSNNEVVVSILLESLIMSLIGAVIGSVIGVVGAYVLSMQGIVIQGANKLVIRAPPAITPGLILGALAMTVIVGVVGGIIPAYQAAKIPPAVALRYE